jgi:hypothetical protein
VISCATATWSTTRPSCADPWRPAVRHAGGVEAAYGWGWLVDLLEELELEPHLVHPSRCKAIAAARLKNDKVDAATLAQLLRADLLPEAWIAPQQVRGLRVLLRHRAALVRLSTSLKNRLHAVLADRGIGEDHISCGPGPGGPGWPGLSCQRPRGRSSRTAVGCWMPWPSRSGGWNGRSPPSPSPTHGSRRLRPRGVVPLCARGERSPYGGQRADLEQVEYRARERPLDILAVAEHGLAVDGQQVELLELSVGGASPLDALGFHRLLEDTAAWARPEGDVFASGRHLDHCPGQAQPVAVGDHAPVDDHLPEAPVHAWTPAPLSGALPTVDWHLR